MGTTHPALQRAIAPVLGVVLAASFLSVQPAQTASADSANPAPVSSQALPTPQVNGVVWSQVISNGVDYVAGSFDQSQPAGAAAGADVSSRANLFAFDVSTGAAVPFSATTNAQVRGVAASADGSRIYIVGDFTSVNGQPRNHIAAVTRSGDLVAGFAPSVNSAVYAVAVRGNAVYFGGSFSSVGGQPRSRAAAVDAGGAVLSYAPNVADGVVRAVAVSPDSGRVLLGGSFSATNGAATRGLAATDANGGSTQAWASNPLIYNSGTDSSIFSLSTRGNVVYATGYVYKNVSNGNLEGTIAMNWSDGSVNWIEDCHGDSYSSYPFNDAVYVASHAHDCSQVVDGWSSPGTPTQWRRAQAFSQSAVGTLGHNTEANYYDFGGYPSPRLVGGWAPTINTGTYTGNNQGAWSVTGGSSWVVFGGEFTKVNGVRQTGLVRFQGQPEPGDPSITVPTPTATPTPTPSDPATPTPPAGQSAAPAKVAEPSTVALGATAVAVKWSAPKKAKADKVSAYVIRAYKGSRLAKTVTVSAAKRLAVVTGLGKKTTYRIGVAAKNAAGIGKSSSLSSVKTKAKGKNVSATKHPGKVQKPSVAAAKGRVRASWKAAPTIGALPVARYQVRVVLHGKTVKTYLVTGHARTKLVSELKRHTTYTLSVRAGNWAGWGAWSSARSARTR
jgi:hypothetical protein